MRVPSPAAKTITVRFNCLLLDIDRKTTKTSLKPSSAKLALIASGDSYCFLNEGQVPQRVILPSKPGRTGPVLGKTYSTISFLRLPFYHKGQINASLGAARFVPGQNAGYSKPCPFCKPFVDRHRRQCYNILCLLVMVLELSLLRSTFKEGMDERRGNIVCTTGPRTSRVL
jgi:hypothetical protein